MAFDATIGGTGANSYCTYDYANAHFENKLFPTKWNETAENDQKRALMTATLWLEGFSYYAIPTTTMQALKFPAKPHGTDDRTLVLDKYADDEMPDKLLKAECELALYLLVAGEAAVLVVAGSSPVSSLKIGNSVEVKYATGDSAAETTVGFDSTGLPIHVARLLSGLRLPAVFA